MKFGLDLPNMGGAGDPRLLAEIAHEAEESGWDGVFIFDSILSPEWESQFPDDPEKRATVDPWIALAAMAMRTERVTLGTMVTPLSRRRPWKVARETVTLDHLSNGRLVLPVGLGTVEDGGYMNVGEELDRKKRAEMLDESLAIIEGLWSGEPFAFQGKHYDVKEMRFEPKPVQSPRIPIWVVGAWPRMKSMRRAVRWDGILPIVLPAGTEATAGPDVAVAAKRIAETGVSLDVTPEQIGEIRDYAQRERDSDAQFDIVLEANSSPSRPEQAAETLAKYEENGATWYLEAIFSWLFLPPHDLDRMRDRIRQGPPRAK
ncbi:MAG: LLM class flavin-dependent oxidoreductase [Chloroflexi bacterium]|nr:LLM class flavin-dependent oxidoreductase [Chloroflexota bacterium]